MARKRGVPDDGELVICTVTRINPNSAFVKIQEYDLEGMVHISEIASGWVKDIRKFVKQDQTVVAKVIRKDDRGVLLSMKRVDTRQANERTKEFRLSQRAEKMLEIAAKELGKTLDQAYDEVGYLLQDAFGSVYEGFRTAVTNPQLLAERGVAQEWIGVLVPIAEKNIEQKDFEFRARLRIRTTEPDGITVIKAILKKAERSGLSVHYIAAPEYLIRYTTKNAKKGEKEFESALEGLTKEKHAAVEAERI